MRGNRVLRRNLDTVASGKALPEMADPPKKSVKSQIRHPPKKAFDYRVIMEDGFAYFVVAATVSSDKAAEMFRRFRPKAGPMETYAFRYCRYNVSTQEYELCDDQPGAFPVHAFYMEE